MAQHNWTVYLSGEIHSDWREQIKSGINESGLPIDILTPVTDHASSDDCGAKILGEEDIPFWRDHKGAKINSIRTRTLIERSDVVVVRFGEKFKQWNAAFDAGYAHGLGIPIVTLHDEELVHPLKEIDAAAQATAKNPGQIVELLEYLLREF